jgi:hypothetical protein
VDLEGWDAALAELSKSDADAAMSEAVALGKKVRAGSVSAKGSTLPEEERDLHYIP